MWREGDCERQDSDCRQGRRDRGPARARGVTKNAVEMPDRRLPACSPEILRHHPIETVGDLRRHAPLHSTTTRAAWPAWLSAAGVPNLVPLHHVEFDHVYLHLQAAVDGLGVALASLPLIENDIAAGRLVCPLAAPEFRADDYQLVISDKSCARPRGHGLS
jgi:LysR family transcriptional regulator, glycine cleavage system transcriptional activator